MTDWNPDEVRERYAAELFDRIVPFWETHSIDRECGGYLHCLDREGDVYDTFKDMWMEWRECYMFAALANQCGRNPRFLELARHGYDFLFAKGRKTDGSYFTRLNRDGTEKSLASDGSEVFTNGFAAMACAELFRATGEGQFRDEALSCWAAYKRLADSRETKYRQLAHRVIGLNVMNVFNGAFSGEFVGEANRLAEEMRRFVEPRTGLFLERMRVDWTFDLDSQYGRFINPGHAVEAMSFLFGHIAASGCNEHLAFARDMAIRMFDFGWDAERGGGFVYRDALGLPVDKTDWLLKTWWADCEAATAMLRGWRLTGEDRFAERFRLVDAYDWANFRDPDFPEWFAYAPVEGRRIHTYKGNVRKGFFHLPRRLLECCETLGGCDALLRARASALAPRADRVMPVAVVWAHGDARAPETLCSPGGGCAGLRSGGVFALDFGKSSVEGWAVIRVKSEKGHPVLRLAYANYPNPDALRDDGDFNEETRARYMGRDVELPVLPANVNRHELYRIHGPGTYVAPMLMPQFRYMRVQLDTPGEVEIESIAVAMRNVCDTAPLDGYFLSSDADANRLWQIGVWTAQLATIKTTWACNAVEGRIQPRKLTRGADVHLCVARDAMPESGSLSASLVCGVNPAMLAHAGLALFAADKDNALLVSLSERGVLRWVRRNGGEDNTLAETTFDAPLADGATHALEITWRPQGTSVHIDVALDGERIADLDYRHRRHGRRMGFWSRKGWWPSWSGLAVRDAAGAITLFDDFADPTLPMWEFERPEPFVSDGAKRDRLVWSGDLYWAGRNLYYAFADCSSMRKTIALLARNQTPEGYIQACPYADQPPPRAEDWGPFESDEFAAWFVPVLYDYWLHSGDDGAAREFLPVVWRLLDYLGRHTGQDGIFEQRPETSKHAFAPSLQKGDMRHRSYMDILLWMCWRHAAEMARAVGEVGEAEKWEAQAGKVRAAANRAYWDEDNGLFRASIENIRLKWCGEGASDNGSMVEAGPVQPDDVAMEANALAVESGFATPEQARRICPRLKDQSWVRKFILLSAIAKARSGFGEDAWRILADNRWGVFSDPDWDGPWATAEGMDEPRYGSGDQSHPDVAPAGYISSCILGIVPVEPGFRRFAFAPNPPDGMTFAEGRIPTRFGPIDARWERTADGDFVFELTVPDGTTADIVPPPGCAAESAGRALRAGKHRLVAMSKNVL